MCPLNVFFCECSFVGNVYFLGESIDFAEETNACIKFNSKDYIWKELAGMNAARADASCTVFEAKIVVTGE